MSLACLAILADTCGLHGHLGRHLRPAWPSWPTSAACLAFLADICGLVAVICDLVAAILA